MNNQLSTEKDSMVKLINKISGFVLVLFMVIFLFSLMIYPFHEGLNNFFIGGNSDYLISFFIFVAFIFFISLILREKIQ